MSNLKPEPFTCQREDLTIRGLAYLPEGGDLPLVLVSHGFMATYQTTRNYAQWFAQRGYAAFCFDFCGGGIDSKSDGDTEKMSLLTEEQDLEAVIRYAAGRKETNGADLTLMGCSQGGFVSAMAASKWKEKVKRLILFYPAFCIPDAARSGHMIRAEFDPDHIPETFFCGSMKLGKCYPESVLQMHYEEMIRPFKGDVLIVQGDQDRIADVSYAKEAARIYANAVLKIIPGAGHGFQGKEDQAALEYTDEFLRGKITNHKDEREHP